MLRVIFAGTPEFAASHLQPLLEHPDFDVIAVYTQPDRPAGRGKKLQASAVKQLALAHNITVEQPASLKSAAAQQQLASYAADIMVVVAYGLLLPQVVLDTPRYGCINVHGSLLPRWRGAAPIQRAIWAGDKETGVAIMQMDAGLDTGAVLAEARLPITATDTSATLYQKLAELGPQTLVETLEHIPAVLSHAQPQAEQHVTYARKLSKDEAQLDWQRPALELERWVRAFNPWPIAWLCTQGGEVVKVWQAEVVAGDASKAAGTILRADKKGIVVQTSSQALCLTQLQPAGKKPMTAADFVNGRGDWLSSGTQLPLPRTDVSAS